MKKSAPPVPLVLTAGGLAAFLALAIHNECLAKIEDPARADRILNPHRAGTTAVPVDCARHRDRVEVGGEKDSRRFEFGGVTSHRNGPKHPFAAKNLEPPPPGKKKEAK